MKKKMCFINLFIMLSFSTNLLASDRVDIVLNSFLPPQNFINTKVLPQWAADIRDATNGRINVIVPTKSVAPPHQQWEAVLSGLTDATYMYNGHLPDNVNLALISQLPWNTSKSSKKMSVALWKTYKNFFESKNEYGDELELLGLFVASPAELYSISNKKLTSVDAVKGSKMWALPGPTAELFAAAGIKSVTGPAVRVHEYVSHGVVDGFAGISHAIADSVKATNYIKSVTEFERNMFASSYSLFISKDKWMEISSKDQKAIKKLSGLYLAELVGDGFDDENRKARAKFESNGVDFVKADEKLEEFFKNASLELTKHWVEKAKSKGVNADEVINYYKIEIER